MRTLWLVAIGGAIVGAVAVAIRWIPAASIGQRRHAPAPVEIADPATHWTADGFAEMVPPIRLPTSTNGHDHITVWLRVPDGAGIRVEHDGDRLTLVYPPGTVADRVEMREPADADDEHAWRVVDVRGTRLGDGDEYFHTLQPISRGARSLAGFEWVRSDPSAERAATDSLEGLWRGGLLRDARPEWQSREVDRLRRLNRCEECHEHERPERTRRTEGGPRRATDRAGFYVPFSVLRDDAPLEEHRPRDLNADDPFVVVSCGDQAASRVGEAFRCADDDVPVGHFDLGRALAAGDRHAVAVCRSRRYLHDHMDHQARAAFASAFTSCGLGV